MAWFGRKSGRADARPVLGAGVASGFGEWPRSYEAQMREGYAHNPVAQRAVRLIADGVGSAPIEGEAALVTLVSAHPGGVPLLETLAAHLLLHGNAYVQPVGDGAGGVAALYPLRPERVSVEAGADGWPAAYRYRVGAGVTRLMAEGPRAEVIHLRSFHPADDHYGLGCLGAAAGGIAANGEEALIDLVQSLRAPYRQGASFVMNAATLARVRKLKTADGQLLWQPSLAAGQPASLLGYPVVEAEDMPDIAANSLSIAFGSFRAGYLIAERSETHILRDPYSNKPFVHFYATKRVGGIVSNSQAIKLMKFAAA